MVQRNVIGVGFKTSSSNKSQKDANIKRKRYRNMRLHCYMSWEMIPLYIIKC